MQQNVLLRASYFSATGDENDSRRGSDFCSGNRSEYGLGPDHRGVGDKQKTACTTSPAASFGQGEEKTPNSQTVGKSAVAA